MSAEEAERPTPYTVEKIDQRFEVRAASGRTVMVCADDGSARQYAVLMNEAYRAGYKAGYRDGRGR